MGKTLNRRIGEMKRTKFLSIFKPKKQIDKKGSQTNLFLIFLPHSGIDSTIRSPQMKNEPFKLSEKPFLDENLLSYNLTGS